MKTCSKCKQEKPEEDYNYKIKSTGTRKAQCRECDIISRKRSYEKNKQYYLDKNNKAKNEIRAHYKKVREGNSCSECGESHPACLDYHHLKDKRENVSKMIKEGWSIAAIDKEISKCIVLCSNCHRKLHFTS